MYEEKKYKISYLENNKGGDSLTDFLTELASKHKGQEERYVSPLVKLLGEFENEGPLINLTHSKSFPPYKDLKEIQKDLAELRTYKCRFLIYKIDRYEWIGLHGYEKQGDRMPEKEKSKAKGEIKLWEETKKPK